MSSWREILVEWCNCLQLSTQIKDINELRDSDFFRNVLLILKKTELSDTVDRTFFQTLTLLNDTYKYAQIDDTTFDLFTELPEDRFIIITSLLMHYTCIYDGNDKFTLPLCQNLSKKTQLAIKDFLQNVNKEVSYTDLEKLIGKDIVYENGECKPSKSPLTAVFRTPSLKRKFNHEKDRTVNKLKTALELEQYQKADIEDELNSQMRKTQKLEKLLNKRNEEITALKSEIFRMKCQTPPQHSKKPDSEHTIKLLKKQLENLELYLQANEKEYDQLRDEHHLYKMKVEEYESEYMKLREKYLAYDEQIDELSTMLADKCSKLSHLENHCKELNQIVDGYRQQRPASGEFSFSFSDDVPNDKADTSIVNPENLASTVIEIQLKEAQELNENLMSQVNSISAELDSTKKYLDSKVEENNLLNSKLNNESAKLKEFKQEFQDIKSFFEIESNEYRKSVSFLKQEVTNALSLHEKSVAQINTEIQTEKENNNTLSIKLSEKEHQIEDSEKQIESLNSNINELKTKVLEEETNNNSLKMKISELEKQLIEKEEKLAQEIENFKIEINNSHSELRNSEKRNNEISNRIVVLEDFLDSLKSEKDHYVQEIKEHNTKIEELQTIISKVKAENEDEISKNNHLKELLKNSEVNLEKYFIFEKYMKEHIVDLKGYHKKEFDECNNFLSSLKTMINLLNKKLTESEKLRGELRQELNDNKSDLKSLKDELTKINNDWNEDKKLKEKITTENKSLKDNCIGLTRTNEELNEIIRSLKEKFKQELHDIKSLFRIESNEYKKSVSCLQQELINALSLHEKSVAQLKTEILTEKENNNTLLIKLSEQEHETKNLEQQNESLNVKINELETNVFEEKACNNSLKTKVLELENQLIEREEKLAHEIENFKNETDNSHIELRNSEKKNNEISNRIVLLKESLDSLKSEKDHYIQEIGKQDNKIRELEKIISNMEADSENGAFRNNHLKELLKNSEAKLEKYVIFEKYMKEHIADLKGFHKKEYQECNNSFTNLKTMINLLNEKLTDSEKLQEELLNELNDYKGTNSSLLNDLESLKDELTQLNNDWKEDKKHKEKITSENQSLKDNFIGLTRTIKLFNEELNKIIRSLKERKNKSDSKLNDIHRAYKETNTGDLLKTPEKSHKTNDVSVEMNNLGEQISKLNAYLDIFSEKETFYLKEMETLKEELAASTTSRFDVIETLKEQIQDNEHQISTQTENLLEIVERYNQLQMENQECLKKIEKRDEEIENIKKRHCEEITLREVNIENLQEKVECLEKELISLKKIHNSKTEENIEKLLTLENQKSKNDEQIEEYKTKIMYLEAQVAILKEEIMQLKGKTSKTEEEYETSLANLQVQVVRCKLEITQLKSENTKLGTENKDLSNQINDLIKERDQESNGKKIVEEQLVEEIKTNMQLKNEKSILMNEIEDYRELQARCKMYEKERNNTQFLEEKQAELSQKIETLMKSSEMQKNSYETFKLYYRKFRNDFDKLLSQKNSLENLTNNIRIQILLFNKNILVDNSKKFLEKKETLDIISEDIIKQYNRYSKQINDVVQEFVGYFEANCDNIFASLELKIEDFTEKHKIPELSDQISDLTDRAVDILEQIKISQKEFENLSKLEENKMQQKENILTTSRNINIDKIKEDDLRKKNIVLRQKVTLLENTKSNLEKTTRKLRDENKKLKENEKNCDGIGKDLHYTMLLQEYIAYKEDQEKVLKEGKIRFAELQKEYEEHKNSCMRSSTPIGDKFDQYLEADLAKLQEALLKVRTSNEKLENENMFLKRVVEEHKQEMSKFTSIKEAYDKLLEENNKLMTEVDTMKYKRARDRDEYVRWLKKERTENEAKNGKQIQNIKAEYEMKLERMKDKMIKLYREEVNKEMSKIKGKQHENNPLSKTIERLECELFEAKQKIQILSEKEMRKTQEYNNPFSQMHGSNSQLHDFDSLSLKDFPCANSTSTESKRRNSITKFMEFKHPNKVNPSSLETRKQQEERQIKTLPRSGTIIEEVNIRRRTSFGVPASIGNLQMEDEEEMFNNKYLTDLKQGNCELPSSSEGRDSRVSELAWRNSLVPPHLKSSYPAETQFHSPERFREDDIKVGAGFDDSMSKLLPNEKRKKDFGTTSYKKPGPPTPSKNGGRLSLTGNEMSVTKDQHSESKRSTPGRIRALFTGKSSSRNSTEPTTSPKKRLSIFRR